MPGGQFDSSKTRVAPVFDALRGRADDWVRELLQLVRQPGLSRELPADLCCTAGHWGSDERGLLPPVSLLSWLIRNPPRPTTLDGVEGRRRRLMEGDPVATSEALTLLRRGAATRGWYIFEGPTYPDAIIETPDALIVIEGKRTEAGPTTSTTWMPGRHQIWRHIDAAWEIRGRRRVYGLFIVEAEQGQGMPSRWLDAVEQSRAPQVLESSFPHRGEAERLQIAESLAGVTTWQRVVDHFGLPSEVLIDVVRKPDE